jgi:putative selenate reductase
VSQRALPLTPYPLGVLLGRVASEWESRHRVFDLPYARFFDASAGPDLTADFMGRPAATPVGPAAGPHTQLAQNLVLAWLGGGRIMELKTVQVLDQLDISRPCIDMETVGYNVEWSQELAIEQSLEEYVKAWMMIEILGAWPPLAPHLGPNAGPHVFDMSVGYDLAGISSPAMAAFVDGLRDAGPTIDRLRSQIPEPFAAWRDHPFPRRVADSVTLSTFHGCPPDEIAAITRHLIERHGLDVIVKLNPTLLGYDQVREIVGERLGYDEVRLRPGDFAADLQFDRAVDLVDELHRFAAHRGRRFGIKLTNTLVVENHLHRLPDDPMYLSGAPLHVVATTLLARLHEALPGRLGVCGHCGPVQVSFSAGITKDNLPRIAALGVTPVTVCTDLLKPGGYGRMKPMLEHLRSVIAAAGYDSLGEWRAVAGPDAVGDYAAELSEPAGSGPYVRAATAKPLHRVEHVLERWGCVACNLCVTVCPNDAFVRLPTPEDMEVEGRQQYLCLAELCNECGNCTTFCPEEGEPWVTKPRLFIDPERFAAAEGSAFLVTTGNGRFAVTATPGDESDVPRLLQLVNAAEGLPIRPQDLSQ